ncbi:hypothetical protein FDA48_05885 [Clostridium botulinum]|nr:hypothetical protein [Clostridium botulinum]
MGIKKKYSWNIQKNGITNVKGLEKEQERDEKIIKEESEREVDYRTEYIKYCKTYLIPLIILSIVIIFSIIIKTWLINAFK